MKNQKFVLFAVAASVLLNSTHGQTLAGAVTYKQVITAPTVQGPAAVAMAAKGKCEASTDGIHFAPIKVDQALSEGTIIRTGERGRVDLYFKRTGVAIRLQKESELKLTGMEQTGVEGAVKTVTRLDLTRGSIFTLSRTPASGVFEIKNANGLAIAPGKSSGCYMIAAGSAEPEAIQTFNLANPVALPAASVKFNRLEGKRFEQSTENAVAHLVEFDELQALAESWNTADLASASK